MLNLWCLLNNYQSLFYWWPSVSTSRLHPPSTSSFSAAENQTTAGTLTATDADTITDFTDGTDIIGMSGLNYSDLTIEQGSGDYASHVVVKKTDTGESLTIIQSTSLSAIDENDFTAIWINVWWFLIIFVFFRFVIVNKWKMSSLY